MLATAAEGPVQVWSSWKLTNGVLWPIVSVWMVAFVMLFACGFFGGLAGGVLGRLGSSREMAMVYTHLPGALALGVAAAVSLPFLIGGWSAIYRDRIDAASLAAGGGDVAEVFA